MQTPVKVATVKEMKGEKETWKGEHHRGIQEWKKGTKSESTTHL